MSNVPEKRRLPHFMDFKFHKRNGAVNWMAFYWYWWIVYLIPMSLLGFFVSGELDTIQDIAWAVGWIPLIVFFALDMLQFRRCSKAFDRIFSEEISIMKDFGWSGDPKKVKRLEELRKQREVHEL